MRWLSMILGDVFGFLWLVVWGGAGVAVWMTETMWCIVFHSHCWEKENLADGTSRYRSTCSRCGLSSVCYPAWD